MKIKYNTKEIKIEFEGKESEEFDKLFYKEDDSDIESREDFIKKRFLMKKEEFLNLCFACGKNKVLVVHPVYKNKRVCVECLYFFTSVILGKLTAIKDLENTLKTL